MCQATTNILEFKTKELCQLLWSLGRLDFYHPYFMQAASESVQLRGSDCNDQVSAALTAGNWPPISAGCPLRCPSPGLGAEVRT